MWTMRVALVSGILALAPGASAQPSALSGAVAYTEVLRFDYDQDGETSRVQFWLEFRGQPVVGTPGEEGYRGGERAIYYYLVDLDREIQVPKWHMGFSMMEEPPPSGPYPMNNLSIEANTARFEAFGMKWVIVDGGAGYEADRVTVDDGFRTKTMKLYGGDLRVGPKP